MTYSNGGHGLDAVDGDGYSTWDKQCEAAYAKEYRERKKAEASA